MHDLAPRENASIEKRNGTTVGPYSASFAGLTIFIWDKNADVTEGDVVVRKLPNGNEERSTVVEATFIDGKIKGPHFQIKYQRGNHANNQYQTQHINITGTQAAVQIGSHNSQKIVNAINELEKSIEDSNASPEEKRTAKSLLRDLIENPVVAAIIGGATGSIFRQ